MYKCSSLEDLRWRENEVQSKRRLIKKRDEKVHRMGDSSYNEEKKKKTVKKQSV